MDIVVGIGEYAVTNGQEDVLRTYALSSCVGVTAYCPVTKAAGMLHIVLPSPGDSNGVKEPSYFATTGIPLLINTLINKYSCRKSELRIELYGGANPMMRTDIFDVGRKNIEAAQEALRSLGLKIGKTDLRGNVSRTLVMKASNGQVEVIKRPMLLPETTLNVGTNYK